MATGKSELVIVYSESEHLLTMVENVDVYSSNLRAVLAKRISIQPVGLTQAPRQWRLRCPLMISHAVLGFRPFCVICCSFSL